MQEVLALIRFGLHSMQHSRLTADDIISGSTATKVPYRVLAEM